MQKNNNNLDTNLTLLTKNNSKQIKDLSIKCTTIKLLEDNTRANLYYIKFARRFLDVTPKLWVKKKKIRYIGFHEN